MLRKISLLCVGAVFSVNAMAMNHALAPSLSIEYEFEPNKPEVLTNYTIFTVNAVCTIDTSDESNVLHVKVLNRSGEFNGQTMNVGDVLDVTVRKGDKFNLSAKSAAQVELTNKGQHTLKAACKTV